MKLIYDTAAPKTSVDLSVNSDLLKKSRALNINLSAALEQFLSEQLVENARIQWVDENHNAIRSYNDSVELIGCFADDYRIF